MQLRNWVLLACAAINLYLLGGALLLQGDAYPMLGEVHAGLPAFHAAFSRRLGLVFILPEFLAAFSPFLLLWRRPEGTSRLAVWGCVLLGAAWMALTFTWHLPAHRFLAEGNASPEVMHMMLTSHATRTALLAVKCALLLWMVARVMGRKPAPAS